jgi:hypothetical protein
MAALGYTPVRDVDQPGRQPFTVTGAITLSQGDLGNLFSLSPAVPAGKEFVIETISSSAFGPTGQRFIESVSVQNTTTATYYVPFTYISTAESIDGFNALMPCRAYASPGTSIGMNMGRSAATGTASMSVTVSGYLVDLP